MEKKLLASCVLLFLITLPAIGQTDVSGDVEGTWDLEDTPYIVIDNITVPRNEELEVQPGVETLFDGE